MKRDEVLANPVWHALCGPQQSHGVQADEGRARRYHAEVSIFSAVDRLDQAGWAALAELVGRGGVAILSRDAVPATPTGWTEVYRGTAMQLVAGEIPATPAVELTKLSPADVPEMIPFPCDSPALPWRDNPTHVRPRQAYRLHPPPCR